MDCRVLHVVRRFGPVGGMERYVWCLTSELLELGVEIDILCQSIECDVDPRITVHQLAPSTDRRRWKAMRDFRDKCDKFWLEFEAKHDVIVHSHERCRFHHVTTFHGPPMQDWSKTPWYKKISPRVRAWHRWEAEEVSAPGVRHIVPVSAMIGSKLLKLYPECAWSLNTVIEPGLDSSVANPFVPISDPIKVVFVGKEWKRKGLVRALQILSYLHSKDVDISFDIFGPERAELKHLGLPGWAVFHGWVRQVPFDNYDVLIHPALQEPFGMIVPEALSAGCRVLASDNVGAASNEHLAMRIRSLEDSDELWASSLLELSEVTGNIEGSFANWKDVAQRYLSDVYAATLISVVK